MTTTTSLVTRSSPARKMRRCSCWRASARLGALAVSLALVGAACSSAATSSGRAGLHRLGRCG